MHQMHPNLHGLCLPLCSHKQWIRLQVVGCCDCSLSCATENRFVEGKHMAFAWPELRMSPSKPLYAHVVKRRFAIGWCVFASICFHIDIQDGPMWIIGVDSHADCSNITEAWRILRGGESEKSCVGHHRCQVKTIWCRYDLADSCSQTMGHYRGALGNGGKWMIFTWPHLLVAIECYYFPF